jgi:Cu/Ag efflux protein CusF
MKRPILAFFVALGVLSAQTPATFGQTQTPAPADATAKKPGLGEVAAVKLRGTVAGVDKEKRTVTLKGPKGRTVTLDVQDPQKLDVIKVGDPVVATYYEAAAVQVRKPGSATPGVTVQEGRAGSKPGETPAGVMAREITVTGTVAAVSKKPPSVTIKGPGGNQETVKVRDPKNLENVKVGDLVEITYAQALAVALDKAAK